MSALTPDLRARIQAAFNDRDKLAGGWSPPGELWANAPTLNRWRYAVHPISGTLALSGYLDGESRLTEPVVAMFTAAAGIGWARTLAGWVRLALTDYHEHKAGRMLLPPHAREIEIAAREAGYRAPRPSLQPIGDLKDDVRWEAVARHFEATASEPSAALAVFYARLKRCPLPQAHAKTGAWWLYRLLDFEAT
ncbi:hypothetical protein VQ03_05370 [Methylobacterium tarhaniae]|uniref:Uncharacterized protein n=1 Tax=Methylobacterium tarhaniae TaxID=1187852 RepID=A0A0J6VXJ0_9HYPH|nr:hypothetical protein [Methylobacterium tarhaniae]KMO44011.1 hypothetical protein VQ03_05370 [Methylobacterium tarhaniae]